MISSMALLGTQQAQAAGAVTHFGVSFLQTSFTVGLSNSLIVKALDDTETQVGSYSGAVNITCSDPNAILPINMTMPINGGIGGGLTFHFGTAGSQTITVTDIADNTLVGTLTVTVAPIHFSVTVSPTTITAGESVNVTVTALDAADNIVALLGNSGYGGSIDFVSTDSQAVYPLEGSTRNLINGSRTFNITLNTPGAQTITAINKAFPLVNATTTTITVNAPVLPTATPTAAPSQTATPTAVPTAQPTQAPTATPTPQVTNTSNNNLVIIAVIVIVVIVAVLVAIVFLRKKRGAGSDVPPPPPPPT